MSWQFWLAPAWVTFHFIFLIYIFLFIIYLFNYYFFLSFFFFTDFFFLLESAITRTRAWITYKDLHTLPSGSERQKLISSSRDAPNEEAEIVAVLWFLAEWLALRMVSKVFLTAMGNYVWNWLWILLMPCSKRPMGLCFIYFRKYICQSWQFILSI